MLVPSLTLDDHPRFVVLCHDGRQVLSYHNVPEHVEHNAIMENGHAFAIRYDKETGKPLFPINVANPSYNIPRAKIGKATRRRKGDFDIDPM